MPTRAESQQAVLVDTGVAVAVAVAVADHEHHAVTMRSMRGRALGLAGQGVMPACDPMATVVRHGPIPSQAGGRRSSTSMTMSGNASGATPAPGPNERLSV